MTAIGAKTERPSFQVRPEGFSAPSEQYIKKCRARHDERYRVYSALVGEKSNGIQEVTSSTLVYSTPKPA